MSVFTEDELVNLTFIFDTDELDESLMEWLDITIYTLSGSEVLEKSHRKPYRVKDDLQRLSTYLDNLPWQVKSHAGEALDTLRTTVDQPYEPQNPKYRRDILKTFIRGIVARDHIPYSQGAFEDLVSLVMEKSGMEGSARVTIRDALDGTRPDYPVDRDRKEIPDRW